MRFEKICEISREATPYTELTSFSTKSNKFLFWKIKRLEKDLFLFVGFGYAELKVLPDRALLDIIRWMVTSLDAWGNAPKNFFRNNVLNDYPHLYLPKPEGLMRPQAGGGVSEANGTPANGTYHPSEPRRGDRLLPRLLVLIICHSFGVLFVVCSIAGVSSFQDSTTCLWSFVPSGLAMPG